MQLSNLKERPPVVYDVGLKPDYHNLRGGSADATAD